MGEKEKNPTSEKQLEPKHKAVPLQTFLEVCRDIA